MEHTEHNDISSTQTVEQIIDAPTAMTETQVIRAVVARVLAKTDCECTLQGSTSYQPGKGMVTSYAYVDQYGRNWGYDSTCGGQVKPKAEGNSV